MQITVKELLKINNANIIDVRSIEKYNNNHIPGAINVPSNVLIYNHFKYLNHSDTYYIYCQKGLTSKMVVEVLRNFGYKVVNVIGGYEAYILNS